MLSLIILFVASHAHTHRLWIDTEVQFTETGWFREKYHYYVPHSGTNCRIYVKHGDNPTRSREGIEEQQRSQFAFPQDHFVSLYQQTWIWTSCNDALVVDYFELEAAEGTRRWGLNNRDAWCVSGDATDANFFNDWSDTHFGRNTIVMKFCARTFLLGSDEIVYYYPNQWHPSSWEADASGRRLMQEEEIEVDSTLLAVQACEDDVYRSQEDCDQMVDELLQSEIANSAGWLQAIDEDTDPYLQEEGDVQETTQSGAEAGVDQETSQTSENDSVRRKL